MNQAIRELVGNLDERRMRGWGTTRRALFEQLDRPALLPLPPTPYEYAAWKRCRVNLDHHVEIDKHFYSVPFRLLRDAVEARVTARTVEIFTAATPGSKSPGAAAVSADHARGTHAEFAPALSRLDA